MNLFKKTLSLIMAFVMALSCLCVGAFAADEQLLKPSISKIEKYDEATHSIVEGNITEANAGDIVVVTFSIENQAGPNIKVCAFDIFMECDATLLTPYIDETDVDWDGDFYENSYVDVGGANFTVGNPNPGEIILTGSTASGVTIRKGASAEIGQVAFEIADDAESAITAFTFDATKENLVSDLDSNLQPIDITAVTELKINGAPPTLKEVVLSDASVEVNGTTGATLTATALSTKEKNVSGSVTWSVAPADQDDVTITADGTITVDPMAEEDTYTVTATPGSDIQGAPATKSFTVTRATPVLTKIDLSKTAVTVDGTEGDTITVTAEDQYGSAMEATVSVEPTGMGVAVSGNTITVAKDAAEDTYTVSADGVDPVQFTVSRAGEGVVIKFNAKDVVDPVIIPADDTVAEVSLAANVSNAEDIYGTTVPNPSVTFTLADESVVAGITIEGSTLKVTKAAAAAIESSMEVEVEATIDGVKKIIKVTVKRDESDPTSVVIESDDGTAVADAITVGIPSEKAITAVVYDQYGTEMDVEAALTLSDATPGIELRAGKLIVDKGTEEGETGATATLTATYSGVTPALTDSVAITAKKVTPNWIDEVSAKTEITYGETNGSAITLREGGKGTAKAWISTGETTLTGVYTIESGETVSKVTASPVSVKVIFTVDEGREYAGSTFEETYPVKVNPATLTVTGAVVTKEFNNSAASAKDNLKSVTLSGIVGTDDVKVDLDAVTLSDYSGSNYGTWTVNLSTITLIGDDKDNYTVAPTYACTNATITKTKLVADNFDFETLTEATYDGTAKTVDVTANVPGAGAITVLYNGSEIAPTDAGEYTITINVADGTNYAEAKNLSLGDVKLVIAKAKRTITPDASTIVLVGETPVDVKITTDAEAEVSVSTSVDEVIVLESYSENVATFTALDSDVTTVTFSAPESDNYLAGSATVKAISIPKPINGRSVSGAFNIDCDYDKVGQITLTAESVNPELAVIEFLTPDMGDAATITLNPANPIPLTTTELTVTIEVAGLDPITVPYNVSITINKVAAKVNPVDDEFGIVDVLPDEVYDAIYDAAEEAGVDEVNVSVSTVVEVKDGKVTVTPTYTVTDAATDDPLIVDVAIKSTTDPVVVDVELEDVAEGTKLMVKNADGEYETVTVADSKIAIETADFTKAFEIVEPATITINFTYNKAKEDGSTTESKTYTIADLEKGTALPEDSKSGYTFKGWQIGEKVYTALTAELFDPANDEDGIYDATASFKKKSSGGGGISYVISVEDADNGTVKSSKKTAGKGDTVTITVTPDKGYELDELTVTDKSGDELKLKSKGDGKYTFTMPKGKVYVEATFEAVEVEVEVSFSDVAETDSYFDAVEWAVAEGITTGYANGTFLPGNTVTRAQAVTFLWRAMGEPEPETTKMPFVDVPVGSYYYDAVLWAVENGITTGMTETTFVPDRTISRAQTITFLWRTAKMEGYDVSVGAETNILSYADAMTIGEYAIPAMQWACGEQIVDSYADGTLRPNEGCSRAQTVTFLYRFLG